MSMSWRQTVGPLAFVSHSHPLFLSIHFSSSLDIGQFPL